VNGCLDDVGAVLGADRDVSQLARPRRRSGPVEREGEHVGGRVPAAMLAVQLADALGVDDLHSEMAILHAGGVECRGDGVAQLGRHIGEIDRHRGRFDSRSACSP
jgi:hypothetical protein